MGHERIPALSHREESAARLDDGTTCRLPSPLPGAAGGRGGLTDLTPADKLILAMRRTSPKVPAEVREQFDALLSGENLAITAGVLAFWGASHLFGVGVVVDLLVGLSGLAFLGLSIIQSSEELAAFVRTAGSARSEADLDRAAGHLAHFVSVVGVATLTSLLLKASGRLRETRLSGGVRGGARTRWWQARDFGPDWPNTSVPQSLVLEVGKRQFHIKPNATKHLAERSRTHAGAGARLGQVDFPLSSLAGALEQAELQGRLTPLTTRQATRVGTPEQPLHIGDWELSIEAKDGRLELLHAVYRP